LNLSAAEFEQLRGLVHQWCGLALAEEKAYLLRHRLGPVARSAGCANFAAFLRKLAGPEGTALRELVIEAITTKETAFFRDRHPFDVFRRVILPQLGTLIRRRLAPARENGSQGKGPDPFFGRGLARLWCAGVSTGQEAYSLAMMIDDYLRAEGRDLRASNFGILATDISDRVLAVARAGRYSDAEVERGVSPAWRERYFQRVERDWVIAGRLRELVAFRRFNLMESFAALGWVDIIFCRNVLIYFDEAARRRLCDGFADLLPANGLLVLGAAENLYGISTRLVAERIEPTLVYRKI
jgi:chemotaxis protein methyltransferase CheR